MSVNEERKEKQQPTHNTTTLNARLTVLKVWDNPLTNWLERKHSMCIENAWYKHLILFACLFVDICRYIWIVFVHWLLVTKWALYGLLPLFFLSYFLNFFFHDRKIRQKSHEQQKRICISKFIFQYVFFNCAVVSINLFTFESKD